MSCLALTRSMSPAFLHVCCENTVAIMYMERHHCHCVVALCTHLGNRLSEYDPRSMIDASSTEGDLLDIKCWTATCHVQAMQSSPTGEEAQADASSTDRVEAAEAEVIELQRKVELERQAFAQISAKLIASTTHFDLQVCCLVSHTCSLMHTTQPCTTHSFARSPHP